MTHPSMTPTAKRLLDLFVERLGHDAPHLVKPLRQLVAAWQADEVPDAPAGADRQRPLYVAVNIVGATLTMGSPWAIFTVAEEDVARFGAEKRMVFRHVDRRTTAALRQSAGYPNDQTLFTVVQSLPEGGDLVIEGLFCTGQSKWHLVDHMHLSAIRSGYTNAHRFLESVSDLAKELEHRGASVAYSVAKDQPDFDTTNVAAPDQQAVQALADRYMKAWYPKRAEGHEI